MTRRYVIIILVLLVVLAVWLLWPEDQPDSQSLPHSVPAASSQKSDSSTVNLANPVESRPPMLDPAQQDQRRKSAIETMRQAFSAPIVFFGKAVDEKNNPIAGAVVHYSVANNPLKDGEKHEGISDADGLFSLSGVNGASLYVTVWKEGYYPIGDLSGGSFGYGVPNSSPDRRDIPAKDNPAIFVLRKMGQTVPLIATGVRVKMPKDGSPVAVDLETGRAVPGAQGDVVVECWTQNQGLDPNKAEHYKWKFRLTVPGGGLTERTDEFVFEAPLDGYRPAVEFAMPKDSERWKPDFEAEYFVKLASGHYARMRFRITTGGTHSASVSAYLNPTPGSRNLEYDPAKKVP